MKYRVVLRKVVVQAHVFLPVITILLLLQSGLQYCTTDAICLYIGLCTYTHTHTHTHIYIYIYVYSLGSDSIATYTRHAHTGTHTHI